MAQRLQSKRVRQTGVKEQPTKKSQLLRDPDVKRWYDNLVRGSKHTGDVALRRLSRFCEIKKTTPKALLKWNKKKTEDEILDLVTQLEAEDYAPDYIGGIIKAIKSWFSHNRKKIDRKFKVKDAGFPVTLTGETSPTPPELDSILNEASLRGKASISLVAYGGIRPESLGNAEGNDGLTLADLPDFNLKELKFETMPAMVIIRRELSKAGHQYFTFLNERGCNYISEYFRTQRQNETLTPKSPVIRATGRKLKSKFVPEEKRTIPFVSTANIEDEIRRAIRKAGFHQRPYVLRTFFDTFSMSAEGQGAIIKDFRVFFMGHKGDMERRYTLSKMRLPPDVIEDMREAYGRACKFFVQTREEMRQEQEMKKSLEQQQQQIEKLGEDTKNEIWKSQLKMLDAFLVGRRKESGAPLPSAEEYAKRFQEHVGRMPSVEELATYISEEREIELDVAYDKKRDSERIEDPPATEQRRIPATKINKYTPKGWKVVHNVSLDPGYVLIERYFKSTK